MVVIVLLRSLTRRPVPSGGGVSFLLTTKVHMLLDKGLDSLCDGM